MEPESIAALSSVITALAVFVVAWRGNRKLEVIKTDVNSNMHAAVDRIRRLEAALGISEGEDPPERQQRTED